MNYDVYDILTIDGQEYVVVSKVLEANKWYFLLNEITGKMAAKFLNNKKNF